MNETTMDNREEPSKTILLTGATGYVGGRLLPELQLKGYTIRCMVRHPENLRSKVDDDVEVVAGDVLQFDTLAGPMNGVTDAYYLIHSMGSKDDFEKQDRIAAENFARAAAAAGVKRIVYLGGLGDESEGLSPHLRSRHEVGKILASRGTPVVELRASAVIGSGSLSFELIRALVEKLPIMVTPKWVSVKTQPISITDLIGYLLAALTIPDHHCGVYEIGGSDVMSYADLMKAYARCRKLPLKMIPVPVLTPYLSSLWLGLVTPVYARIGRKLINSITNSTIVRDDSALTVFGIRPSGIDCAIQKALVNEDRVYALTRWSDALSSAGEQPSWFGVTFGSRQIDSRTITVDAPPDAAFDPIRRIGGKTGWYAWNWLWRLRGFMDLLLGGVGFRRGRSRMDVVRVGDTIDFWRVTEFEPGHRLMLQAEMKVPGRAWLEFEVTGHGSKSTIRQTAIFDPVGIFGRFYWYLLWPLHQFVFQGMLNGIAKRAVACAGEKEKKPLKSTDDESGKIPKEA